MNRRKSHIAEIIYRRRSNPYRIVPLDSLRKTNSDLRTSDKSLVCSGGRLANLGSWKPLPRLATPVEVSPSSWKGLRSRMLAYSDGIEGMV
ncbi:MAG: hypothetical protein L7R66_00795 [Candidatus Thalassarchaeaceae archaeon]|nr:hypothetical protein [Candidatus Thalassarchaeaceae archaeon]|tara:strand:+ start:116 stop:388 length:273 start_codon:yes stop_codon:yes gene_type:complete